MAVLQHRDLGRGRQQIVHQRRRQRVAVGVVAGPLVQRAADALHDPARDLALHDRRIDHHPAVLADDVAQDGDPPGVGVHLAGAGVGGIGVGDRRRLVAGRVLEPGRGVRRQGLRVAVGRGRHVGQRHVPRRRAQHRDHPAAEAEVSGGGLQQVRRDGQDLVAHPGCRGPGGSPGDHGAAAPAGAEPVRRAVALMQRHRLHAHAELVRDHLGDCGLEALAVRARSHVHAHGAVGLDPHDCSLRAQCTPADRRRLHEQAQADPQEPALGAGPGLLGPERLEVEHGRGLLQRLGRGDAVVDAAGGRGVGKLAAPDDVAPPELERVHSEPVGHQVHHELAGDGLHLPRAAIGASAHRVGEHGGSRPAHPGDPVGAGEHRHQVGAAGRHATERVGPAVAEVVDLGTEDLARPVHRHHHLHSLDARRVGRDQVLPPVLDPLQGPAQILCGEQHSHLLASREHLLAERPAHVAHVDVHLMLADSEDAGRGEGQLVGALRRGPDVEPASVELPVRHQSASLHGHVALPLLAECLGHHQVSRLEHGRQGGIGPARDRGEVGSQLGMDQVRALGCLLEVDHRRPGLVVDLDQLQGILGRVAVPGDHECHRIAHEPDVAGGQHVGGNDRIPGWGDRRAQ